MTVEQKSLAELHALGDRLAREWMPTDQERAASQVAVDRNDTQAFKQIAATVQDRRRGVIQTLAAMDGLEAAFLVGRMAVMRGYSQLGQYLAVEMFGEDAVRAIDPGAALRFMDIR